MQKKKKKKKKSKRCDCYLPIPGGLQNMNQPVSNPLSDGILAVHSCDIIDDVAVISHLMIIICEGDGIGTV